MGETECKVVYVSLVSYNSTSAAMIYHHLFAFSLSLYLHRTPCEILLQQLGEGAVWLLESTTAGTASVELTLAVESYSSFSKPAGEISSSPKPDCRDWDVERLIAGLSTPPSSSHGRREAELPVLMSPGQYLSVG